MKVLSIRQPWANLIVHGFKNVENRTWQTDYRGPVLIHAGLQFDHDAVAWIHGNTEYYFETDDSKVIENAIRQTGAFGGIIGRVFLKDITTDSKSQWAQPGVYHWHFANAQSLPFVQLKGQQKLFNLPKGMAI
jgi:hypothetical protein